MKPNIQSYFRFTFIVAVAALVLAGTQAQAQLNYQTPFVFTTLAGTLHDQTLPPRDGCGSAASFFGAAGMAVDGAGNVYVADLYPSLIRKITPDGCVTTLTLSNAGFGLYYPVGVALDSAGNIYVTDTGYGHVFEFNPAGVGINSLIFGGFGNVGYNAVDSAGNIYVKYGFSILKISPTWVVTTLAGTYGVQGSADGVGSAAQFWWPEGIAVDASGNVYVADNFYNYGAGGTIRKITSAGVVSTLAGQTGVPGFTDGTGTAALFTQPTALAVDSAGNVYVSDLYAIRKVTPAGVVTTIGGGTTGGYADGVGAAAQFGWDGPGGLAVGPNGAIYVSDTGNNLIRVGVPFFVAQVQQPINADGSSVFNVRRGIVPVKFTLTQGGVTTCDLPPATIALTRTSGGTTGAIDESVYTSSADTGSNFRIDSCHYVYNLSSGALGPGTYRVDIFIDGSVVGSGTFGLK